MASEKSEGLQDKGISMNGVVRLHAGYKLNACNLFETAT